MILINTNLSGYCGSHMFLIAGKHHCFVYSGILKVGHCLGGVLLDAVRYHYVAGILSVNSHMDYRALVMAGTPSGTYLIHQFAVAHCHATAVYTGYYSVTCGLLDIGYNTVILLVRICVTQGHCNGMGRVALHMGGQMQQFVVVYLLRMNGGHLKHALGQRSGLVKHYRLYAGQFIQEVRALYQNTLAGCAAQSAKECERDRYHQRARARYHQEQQSAIYPCSPLSGYQTWNHCNQHCKTYYNRCIYACKPCNETLAAALALGCVLHKFQNL